MPDRTYIAIDLKSFYASVECVERGLDPAVTNLVVADGTRTDRTICLAVSLSMKKFGISGRPRLFEVKQAVEKINRQRRADAPHGRLTRETSDYRDLCSFPDTALSFVTATPRMSLYIKYSTEIYGIYLDFVAPDDIHVYSIDEVFIDATPYMKHYGISARELAKRMVTAVKEKSGIIATAGIGTNLYLCKVALDIMAKHAEEDGDGVRVAYLDERTYREKLWNHTPITDFWRVGRGYAARLDALGLTTMGDIARCSAGKTTDFYNEDLLYRNFGVNAELLIDHAWGYESCTIADIKAYRPESTSICSGQVLMSPYDFAKAETVVKEMAETLAMDLFEKGLVTRQITLTVGYEATDGYAGESRTDMYGRRVPKHAHGTANLPRPTSSVRLISGAADSLFAKITDRTLLIRRINIVAADTRPESAADTEPECRQESFFDGENPGEDPGGLERERRLQRAASDIRKKYGKNALVKARDLSDGATQIQRNDQIGGHRK